MEALTDLEFLQIERELAGAGGEAAMKRYDEALVALDGRAREAAARGLPPDEYARCAELSEAVTVARKLLRLQRMAAHG